MTTIRDLTIFTIILFIALLVFAGSSIIPQMTTVLAHAAQLVAH